MEMHKRYSGSFLSRKGIVWRVDILQMSTTPFENIGDLDFPGDNPLSISWEEISKEKPIVGSVATLTIISPGDRTYEDLYTVTPGMIRMDVYRENELYWSGVLDPEFYEEPYERADNYDVSLTFTDFGILDRLNFDGKGVLLLSDIVTMVIDNSGIEYKEIDTTTYISTKFQSDAILDLSKISLNADNFYDEENFPSTLREVAEGVLQPLGLRMTQRNGKIWIYDLNGLYEAAQSKAVEWSGANQTLGVDKVINNIRITFSPYAGADIIDAAIDYDLVADRGGSKIKYYVDHDWNGDREVEGFDLVTSFSTTGLPLEEITPGYVAATFRIDSIYSGQDTAGMAWLWMGSRDATGGYSLYDTVYGPAAACLRDTGDRIPFIAGMSDKQAEKIKPLFKTKKKFVKGNSDPFSTPRYKLKITMDLLLDPRYNPFEPAAQKNEEGNYGRHKEFRRIYVPARLLLYAKDGRVFHYMNRKVVTTSNFIRKEFPVIGLSVGQTVADLPAAWCGWIEGEGAMNDFWLSYYDISDPKRCYGEGWVTNRPCIGAGNSHLLQVPRAWAKRPAGEFILPPPVDGEIELQICSGIATYFVEGFDFSSERIDKCRWLLYKDPKITWCDQSGEDIETDDIEYSAAINPNAKDELQIDTICGTMDDPVPNARGLYVDTSTNLPIEKLKRADSIDHPEMLLASTLYSQYADRHAALSGEVEIDCGDLTVYTERCQGDKIFMMAEETQNVIEDTSEIKIIELSPDDYEAMQDLNA